MISESQKHSTAISRNDFLELEILECVEKTPQLSHRVLAAQLGCNLRLTHALLTKLLLRGWLEVRKLNSREWHYFLTPSGISEKLQRTCRFFDFSMRFYEDAKNRSFELGRTLNAKGIRDVAFIGCGNLAEIAYIGISQWGLSLIEVYGDDAKTFIGRKVLPISGIGDSRAKALIVCIYDRNNPFFTSALFKDERVHTIF